MRDGGRKDERIKQSCVHYSTLASDKGALDLLGNVLMTVSCFPCKQYGFPGRQQEIIALFSKMTKSGIDSQKSVSNSPVVPELKADFLEIESRQWR